MEKITDKYYLGSNRSTYTVYERRISPSTGKESFKNIAYCSSLDNVYNFLISRGIREDLTLLSNIKKISEMINELKEFTLKYVNKNE